MSLYAGITDVPPSLAGCTGLIELFLGFVPFPLLLWVPRTCFKHCPRCCGTKSWFDGRQTYLSLQSKNLIVTSFILLVLRDSGTVEVRYVVTADFIYGFFAVHGHVCELKHNPFLSIYISLGFRHSHLVFYPTLKWSAVESNLWTASSRPWCLSMVQDESDRAHDGAEFRKKAARSVRWKILTNVCWSAETTI